MDFVFAQQLVVEGDPWPLWNFRYPHTLWGEKQNSVQWARNFELVDPFPALFIFSNSNMKTITPFSYVLAVRSFLSHLCLIHSLPLLLPSPYCQFCSLTCSLVLGTYILRAARSSLSETFSHCLVAQEGELLVRMCRQENKDKEAGDVPLEIFLLTYRQSFDADLRPPG